MKKIDFQPEEFRELTCEEQYTLNGGGFAFDVGRLIRFVIISGPNGMFTQNAILDAAVNHIQ